ncbi:hypothetical protein [Algoriphagus sp. A40]|uniref:hypothetical protein n=1 Tax=Algoriphagus sp. A40 TaxID=1945863 RepID=UPI001C2C41E9|nr:hypothetical protein [Algoriphagus sp. A40]
MKDLQKLSIRFFDDREVRALWDEANAKWWFSVLDIIAVLTNQDDYWKTRNYWKYLKAKLKKERSQLVSTTTQLKLTVADGKKYKSDMLDYEGIIALGNSNFKSGIPVLSLSKHQISNLEHRIPNVE